MQTGTCDLCGGRKEVISNRHRLVCVDCSYAEIDDQLRNEGLPIIEDGRPTTYRLGYVTPRAYRFR